MDTPAEEHLARLNVAYARRSLTTRPTHHVASKAEWLGDVARRQRTSIGKYRNWCTQADAVGFPVGGMTMALALNPDELVVYTSTFVRGRPKRRVGAIRLRSIGQITAVSGITRSQIVILFSDGGIIELEALSRGRAKRFVAKVLEQRDRT